MNDDVRQGPRTRTRLLLVTSVLVAAVAGVGLIVTPRAGTAVAASRPSEPSLPAPVSGEQERLLDRAESILTLQCVARAGFKVWLQEPYTPPPHFFPYVLDDPAFARQHGYGSDIVSAIDRAVEADPNHRYVAGLDPVRQARYVRVMNGERPEGLSVRTPDGSLFSASDDSCRSQAQAGLYGDLRQWYRVDHMSAFITRSVQSKVRDDARYSDALSRWSACMKASGLPYAEPAQLRAALPPSATRAQEVRSAEAEARCAVATPLSQTVRDLDQAYRSALERQYRVDVVAYRTLQSAALERARAVVGNSPTHQ